MADNVLSIVLNAETEKAQKAIQDFAKKFDVEIKGAVSVYDAFEKKIKEVETALKNSKSPEEVAKLTTKLREAKGAFNEIKTGQFSTQLATAAKNTNQASFAVLNLGRIAQDSAFGFIGIANNIEPFIQSVTALRASATQGASATKQFFGALAGPAGIGLLIGAVQLFDAYQNGYGIFANKAKVAEKAQKDFNEELNKVKAPAIAAGVQLQAFVDIAANSALPLAQRNKALEEGNKVLGDYGTKLTLANVASEAITAQTKLFTQALLQQAVAGKFADEVATLFLKQAKEAKEFGKANDELTKSAAGTNNAFFALGATLQSSVFSSGLGFFNIGGADKFLTALNGSNVAANTYKTTTSNVKDTVIEYNKAQAKAIELLTKLGKQQKDLGDGTGNAAKNQTDYNTALSTQERVISDNLTAVTKYTTALQYLRDIEAERLRIAQQKASDEFTKKIATEGSFAPAKLLENVKPVALVGKSTEELDNLTAINNKVADIKNNFALLGPIIDASFNALAGGENAVEGLKQAIKSLIIQLAKAAILAGIIAIATGGGEGAISFMSAFKSILGLPGKAQGGTVNSGSPYIVGENGPELFVPTGSGNIVSNGRFGNMGGGGGTLSARVSGGDLLFILNQAGNNRSVNFG